MHKLAFYPKLALGNLWRNRRTYLPYLLACVVSIFTFYTMLAINSNGALDGMRGESVIKSFTAIGTVILAIFCSILIFYTNSFLIKRRKKELGLYSILGMEKKNIGVLMLFETVFVAVIALVLGLGLGLLLSQLLFWVLLRMVQFPVMMEMPISPSAIGISMIFFGVIFLLTLLSNLRQVRIANPIDLMAGSKQGEKEPKASWVMTVIGLLCLAGGYFLALYFTSPVEVLLIFLVAAGLVIAGTYCLFTSGSIALLKLLRKNKKYYYKPAHFISVSGMIYRMKQNAAGLATICILSCMILVTVSSTISMNVGVEDSLATQYPYDYEMTFDVAGDADTLLGGAQTIAQQSGVELADVYDYHEVGFTAKPQDGGYVASDDFSDINSMNLFTLLQLDEYNRNEGQNVALADDEALLLVMGGSYSQDTITLNGFTYRVRQLDSINKQQSGGRSITRSFALVLPGQAAITEIMQTVGGVELSSQRTLAFDIAGDEASKARFNESYTTYISELSTSGYFQLRDRDNAREGWYASNGGFLFLGIYFGILFMLAAALIIYYKQMSEGYDDAERFEILQKVGMGEAEVKKTINKQILAVFFMPLIVAVIHVAVAFFPISRAMIIFGVLNIPLLLATTALTILLYALVYLLVFRQTARTYFGIVRRQAATT